MSILLNRRQDGYIDGHIHGMSKNVDDIAVGYNLRCSLNIKQQAKLPDKEDI